MIYALISSGTVLNTIVVSDISTLSNYLNYDHVVRIDQLSPQPGVNWSTSDCITFTAPPPPVLKPKS